MRIDLNAPYANDYKAGYLINGTEKRKMILLVSRDGRKHCTSFARYLMSTKLGRYLDKDEEVDHINNDKSDDRISNLQILTKRENIQKEKDRHLSTLEHGTYSMYHTGKCRCSLCVAAGRDMRNSWYKKHREEVLLKRREKRKSRHL